MPALLGTAALAAVLANMINNLPAVLVLLPLALTPRAPAPFSRHCSGSISAPTSPTPDPWPPCSWRRIMREHDTDVDLGEFTRLGLLTVPAALILAVLALWASLHAIGG